MSSKGEKNADAGRVLLRRRDVLKLGVGGAVTAGLTALPLMRRNAYGMLRAGAPAKRVLGICFSGGMRSSTAFHASPTTFRYNPWGVIPNTNTPFPLGQLLDDSLPSGNPAGLNAAPLTDPAYQLSTTGGWAGAQVSRLREIAQQFSVVGTWDPARGDHVRCQMEEGTGDMTGSLPGLLTRIGAGLGEANPTVTAPIPTFHIEPGAPFNAATDPLVRYIPVPLFGSASLPGSNNLSMRERAAIGYDWSADDTMRSRLDQRRYLASVGYGLGVVEEFNNDRIARRTIGAQLAQPWFDVAQNPMATQGSVMLTGGMTAALSNAMLYELFVRALGPDPDDTAQVMPLMTPNSSNFFGNAMDCALAIRLLQLGSPGVVVEIGGFDTHSGEISDAPHRFRFVGRLWATLHWLLSQMPDPSTPGSSMLDTTIVCTHSEFGRDGGQASTGFNNGEGSDHGNDPSCYYLAQAVMGGGVLPNNLYGPASANTYTPTQSDQVSVAQFHASLLWGLGLDSTDPDLGVPRGDASHGDVGHVTVVRASELRRAPTVLAALVIACGACTTSSMPMDASQPEVNVPPMDELTAAAYPTATELWGGAQGIYRGCGPNGNVCHNSRQYPNMNSLAAFIWNVGRPCNQLQSDPSVVDDWCENIGDTVNVGMSSSQLAYIQQLMPPSDTAGGQWRIVLQGAAPMLDGMTDLTITHLNSEGHPLRLLTVPADDITADPLNPNAYVVQLGMMGDDNNTETLFEAAGPPGDPGAIQFGDPNRNGIYGALIGARLILPGHPELSYIIKRLTVPTAGPLMPLANCCFWTKPALRALWCWINTLHPDGSNALDLIDYGNCPPGPAENVAYPTPGPTCGVAGVCPVQEATSTPTDPTWGNIYNNILSTSCTGAGCHFDAAAGGLDMHSSQSAYDGLVNSTPPRVIPGNPGSSLMYIRLTAACTAGTTCTRMPLGRPALPDAEIQTIEQWIMMGAMDNGEDAGTGDSGVVDSGTSDVVSMDASVDAGMDAASDIGVDTGAADAGVDDVIDAATDDATDDAGEAAAE